MSLFDFLKKKKKEEYVEILDEANETIICGNCGNTVSSNKNFCGHCGKPISLESIQCPNCMNILNKDSKYCSNCGTHLEQIKQTNIINTIEKTDELEKNNNYELKDSKELDKKIGIPINDNEEIKNEKQYNTSDEKKPETLFDDLLDNEYKDIIDKMVNFAIENVNPGVYYSKIFGKFKNNLEKFNVNKSKDVKKMIDEYLPNSYIKTDKIISIYTSEDDIKNRIIEIAKESNKKFRIFELSKMVPGIKWALLEQAISEAEQKKVIKKIGFDKYNYPIYQFEKNDDILGLMDLQELSDNKMVKKEESIDTNDKDSINTIIRSLFEESGYNITTLGKVLGRLYALDEKIIKKYNLDDKNIKNFIEKNFDYYANDIFISTETPKNINNIIYDNFKDKATVSKEDISSFFDKIGFRNNQSYNKYYKLFLDNDYIRISDDLLIRSSELKINDDELNKIKKVIDFALSNKEIINISKNKKLFLLLPPIDYSWNMYLFMEVCNKYFKDDYVITLDNNEYIIRRK